MYGERLSVKTAQQKAPKSILEEKVCIWCSVKLRYTVLARNIDLFTGVQFIYSVQNAAMLLDSVYIDRVYYVCRCQGESSHYMSFLSWICSLLDRVAE